MFYLVVVYTWLLWKCWLDCAPCFVKHKYLTNVYTWNLQNCPGWKTHFFKRLTPQEDKWVQDVQVHTCFATCNPFHNLHKLKHNVNRYVFSSCIPTYQKNKQQKRYHGRWCNLTKLYLKHPKVSLGRTCYTWMIFLLLEFCYGLGSHGKKNITNLFHHAIWLGIFFRELEFPSILKQSAFFSKPFSMRVKGRCHEFPGASRGLLNSVATRVPWVGLKKTKAQSPQKAKT